MGESLASNDSQPQGDLPWLRQFLNARLRFSFSLGLPGKQRARGEDPNPVGLGAQRDAAVTEEEVWGKGKAAPSCLPWQRPSVQLDLIPLSLHPGKEPEVVTGYVALLAM